MSWTDRLSDIKFEIKTGDGKTYYPLWVSSEKSKDFNVSRFDFINLEGSLVDRKKPQGSTYPLVFMFQGEDNIEQAEAFETSSNDNRMWVIQHPFYGTIKGQPANLKRNDNNYNTTEISIDFWESILGDFPEEAISIVDSVDDKALKVKTISIGLFVENAEPTTADIDTLKTNVTLSSSKFSPDSGSYNSFNNSKKTALKATDSLVTKTENSFTTINKIYDEPSSFNVPVLKKVKSYIEAYKVVKFLIKNRFSKYNFESQSAYIFSGICKSCVNPQEGDYITRNDVKEVNALLIETYKDYLETLDSNQVDIYDTNNSWSPNFQIQNSLLELITFTSKSLFDLGFDAKQERTYELPSDSNLIVLTHRFMGLDANDENIETFRQINKIKNSEIYRVPKGRLIKYFV